MKTWFTIQDKSGVAEIAISDEIGAYGIKASAFKDALSGVTAKDLKVTINSPGGDVFDGVAIYNALKEWSGNVEVVIDGLAASVASVIPLAGDRVRIHENSMMMIHEPWMMAIGDSAEFRKNADVLDKIRDSSIMPAYRNKAGDKWDEEKFGALLANETWLSATEAVELGLADEVIEGNNKIEACFRKPLSKYGFSNLPKNLVCPPANPVAVRNMGASFGVPQDKIDAAIESKRPFDEIYEEFKALETDKTALPPRVSIGIEDSEKFRAAASTRIAISAGLEVPENVKSGVMSDGTIPRNFSGLTRAMLRREQKVSQAEIEQMDNVQLASQAMRLIRNAASGGSGDFENILADVINKSILAGVDTQGTWSQWVKVREVVDYREASFVKLSSFSDISEIPEGAAFELGALTDVKQTGRVVDAGRAYTVTEKALVNDDMNALSAVPMLIGAAWSWYLNKICYDRLWGTDGTGPTLDDGTALFDGTRGNYVTSGAAPSVSTLSAGRVFFRNVTAPKGDAAQAARRLNLQPTNLIVPTSLELEAEQAIYSKHDTSASNDITANPFTNLNLIVDSYIDTKTQTGWWLTADPAKMASVVLLALDGKTSPEVVMERSHVNEPLGVNFSILGSVGAAVEDWRGAYYNDGQ